LCRKRTRRPGCARHYSELQEVSASFHMYRYHLFAIATRSKTSTIDLLFPQTPACSTLPSFLTAQKSRRFRNLAFDLR